MFKNISDIDDSSEFVIGGLKFEANQSSAITNASGPFQLKLISSAGPMISDFVTHESGFHYSTYGIHVGQDDRLTFMGGAGKKIQGYFVDCREKSSTFHQIVRLRFSSSFNRRLVIPRGVAHTFDYLEGVVTRDEPIWYVDCDNPAWNIDNDLVSISRDSRLDDFPSVRVNRLRLPDEAHIYLSKLSQSLLESPKSYLARYPVTIAGVETFVMLEPKVWSNDAEYLSRLISSVDIPGVQIKRNRYALTGGQSYTLVPNTEACIADVLILKADDQRAKIFYWHARTRKIYTFLNNEAATISVECIDVRPQSPTYGRMFVFSVPCDPRISVWIDQGIAYVLRCSLDTIIRCEHEVYADINEPRVDIPMFGQDMIRLFDHEPYPSTNLPTLKCPGAIVYKMAQFEQEQFYRV